MQGLHADDSRAHFEIEQKYSSVHSASTLVEPSHLMVHPTAIANLHAYLAVSMAASLGWQGDMQQDIAEVTRKKTNGPWACQAWQYTSALLTSLLLPELR